MLKCHSENRIEAVVHSQRVLVCFVSSARLGKVDVDANPFTSEELKKALAKMKESEKAERKVSFLFLKQCTVNTPCYTLQKYNG